jgi:hypothetical protein
MSKEQEDYYKRLRDADYDVNPFNMAMLNPGSDNFNNNKNLPLLLPKGPNQFNSAINKLKSDAQLAIEEWKNNFKDYAANLTNDYDKDNLQKTKDLIGSNQSVKALKNDVNAGVRENDVALKKQITMLQALKKELTDKKIEYNRLLHSANASEELKNNKQTIYTETTIRFIMQIIGIFIAGGIVYKVGR